MTKPKRKSWTARMMKGVRVNVEMHLNSSSDGSSVTMPIGTARHVIELLKQLEHLQANHEDASLQEL